MVEGTLTSKKEQNISHDSTKSLMGGLPYIIHQIRFFKKKQLLN